LRAIRRRLICATSFSMLLTREITWKRNKKNSRRMPWKLEKIIWVRRSMNQSWLRSSLTNRLKHSSRKSR
jgi:hypothetical protein